MKENKRIILSVLGIIVLMILIVGITYAGFSQTTSGGNNSISSGTITMTFQEPSNNVVITNAMPKEFGYDTTSFDFSVSGTAKTAMTIAYEISITEKSGNTLSNSKVRIGLKKNGTIIDGFASGKVPYNMETSTVRSGSKKLYRDSLNLTQSGSNYTATDNYQLFLWVDKNANIPNDGSTQSYSIIVNVNSNIKGLGVLNEIYVVTSKNMHIGSTIPYGVNVKSTPELAMANWGSNTDPIYIKHILNEYDEIEESYVGFVIDDTLKSKWKTKNCGSDSACKTKIDNLVNGKYYLKGGDGGATYESNVNTIKTAFNYATQTDICTENAVSFRCGNYASVSAWVSNNGSVNVSDVHVDGCYIDIDATSYCKN